MNNVVTNNEKTQGSIVGTGMVLLGAFGFSAKAVLIKMAYVRSVDPITLLTLRMGFSIPFFLTIAIWTSLRNKKNPLRQRDWGSVVALGLAGYYLASYFDFLGLQYVSAGLERLILFIYPTLVVLLSALFLRSRIGSKEIIAIILSYSGIALAVFNDVVFSQKNVMLGTWLIFISACSYAVYLVGSGRLINRLGATKYTAYVMTISCFAVFFQFTATHDSSTLRLPLRIYELGLAMAVFSTVLPAFLISAGIRRIGASRSSIIGSIGPVMTILLAHYFIGESISILQITGTALVLAGTLLVSGISLNELRNYYKKKD
ncbi:MAG: DMT family transporter [Nitrospiria bacterium]